MDVYLAGKIDKNDWRCSIFQKNKACALPSTKEPDMQEMLSYKVPVPDLDVNIIGPFFLSCDHGCYHGNETHGVGLGKTTCQIENKPFTPEDVSDICKYQIKERAEAVFAYINDKSCYGTLFELGYAHALDIPVIILWDNPNLKRAMWFANESADVSLTLNKDEKGYSISYRNKAMASQDWNWIEEFAKRIVC